MTSNSSFVDNFIDKKIDIYTLKQLLEVNYQLDSLLELIFDDNLNNDFLLNIFNKSILTIKNSNHDIFIILSDDFKTVNRLKKLLKHSKKENRIIVFDLNIKLEQFNNVHYINQIDWMNNIISNGINQNILNLQFIRDLDFSLAKI